MLPIGHASTRQSVERRAVIVDLKVAQLVHDDILNAMRRCLDQIQIECHGPGASAAPPAGAHSPDANRWFDRSQCLRGTNTSLQPSLKDGDRMCTVAIIERCADRRRHLRIRHQCVQVPTDHLYAGMFAMADLQAVLTPQVEMCLSRRGPLLHGHWVKLSEMTLLPCDPRHPSL